ncbi:uncharacterized protein N7503_007569 [Penicillium pulvis]|uniref:uncharacterized protein n=1 Tax=Penicillium pulvis TaxID=1562058 RepID=UPI002547F487|nr:uncharacterized protein N7503_007569 [Penicillium pulvis]KAJ5798273.1 hypothetical protein N7503_007569 [Penicillium pulvis]
MIEKAFVPQGGGYFKELEAIAKSSQKKYEGLFVDFIGWYENDESVFIVMEYMEHGDLDSHLKGPLPEKEAREITLQITEGLKSLHENGFAHRDLKPANTFVLCKSPDWWVKIGDFGISKRVHEKSGLQSSVGSPTFLAPEMQMVYLSDMNDHDPVLRYTEKVDIWALGVMAFYMVFHEYPFSPRRPTSLQQYIQGEDLPFPKAPRSEISESCKSFIKAALAPNVSERLSANQATENEWLRRADSLSAEMTGLKIEEDNFPGNASTEVSPSALGPVQKPTFNDYKDYTTSSSHEAIRAHVLFNSSEPSHGKKSPSPARKSDRVESLFDSSLDEDPIGMQLKELQSLHSLGVQHFRQNDFKKAESMLRGAAQGRKQLRGLKYQETRNTYHCLGVLYYHMARYSEAKQLFQWVLEYQERLFGPKGISTLKSRYWIGVLTVQEGYGKEGMSMLQQVMHLQKDILGPSHPDTLLSRSVIEQHKPQILAMVSQNPSSSRPLEAEMERATRFMQQSIWKIEPLLRRSATGAKRSSKTPWRATGLYGSYTRLVIVRLPISSPQPVPNLKPNDSDSSKIETYYRTMAELGQRLHGQEYYNAAQGHLEAAVSGLQKTLGPTHADSLDALYWLGRNRYELREYQSAEPIFKELLHGLIETLGKSDRKTLNSLHAIGHALSKQGKYQEAEFAFRSAFKGLEKISNVCDQGLVHTLFQIGLNLHMLGYSKQAEPILQDALNRRNYLLGPRAADTIECVFWLGCVLFDLKKYSESEESFRRTRTLRREITDMATSHWLGLAMYCQGKYEQAIPFLHRAFSLQNDRLGKNDLNTLRSSYWLGLAYYHQAKYDEAEHLLSEGMTGMEMLLGLSNEDTLDCLCWYAEVLQEQEKDELAGLVRQELAHGHMLLFGLESPRSLLMIKKWVFSREPQEKYLGADKFFQEKGL